jgi:hypothetical protein
MCFGEIGGRMRIKVREPGAGRGTRGHGVGARPCASPCRPALSFPRNGNPEFLNLDQCPGSTVCACVCVLSMYGEPLNTPKR